MMEMDDNYFAEKILEMLKSFCGDAEDCHRRCDDILLEALISAGYPKTVEAWTEAREQSGFWYA